MEDFITHIPGNLPSTINCSRCGFVNSIPWLVNQKAPFIPQYPNDFNETTNNRIWVPKKLGIFCSRCNNQLLIEIPYKEKKTELHLFGDESYDNASTVFNYTVTGSDVKVLSKIGNELHALKSDFIPELNPMEWRIHMKELWSTKERSKSKYFYDWDLPKVLRLTERVSSLVRTLNDILFVNTITMTKNHPFNNQTLEHAKFNSYVMLILNIIEEATSLGAQPKLFFDSEKASESNNVIHKWAVDSFNIA